MIQTICNILWRFLILVLLVISALVLWLTLRHQPPTFNIVEFTVPTSNSSDSNWVDKHHHGPDILFTLVIKNPSIVYSITYNNILLKAYYNQSNLGKTNFSGFKQGKNKEHTESSHMEADVQLWKTFLEVVSKSSAKQSLKVEVETGVRYKVMGHASKQHLLRFQGQLKIGSDGKISGKKKLKLCKGSC